MKVEIQRVGDIFRKTMLVFFVFLKGVFFLHADVIYLGNGSSLQANAIATDQAGNVYVAGTTTDPSVLSATNVFHLEVPGSVTNDYNVFVLKLDSSGAPVYLTFLGGEGWDSANALAVDTNGSVCVVGSTTSSNFPVVNALQSEISMADDGFVAKLNPSGSALVFSTYFGGYGSDNCTDVKIDHDGYIVIAGTTTSTNLWTVNALQPTNASVGSTPGGGYGGPYNPQPSDAFVAKFQPAGTSLVYATYLGGNNDDVTASLALDEQGNAYVAGYTLSTNFPTQNAFHEKYSSNGYNADAFLTKLSSDGQTLAFSTYLGGVGNDQATSVAVDDSGNVSIAGTTSSPDFPLTNAFPIGSDSNDLVAVASSRGFVTKLSSDGSSLRYSTFLGGTGGDFISGVALDSQKNLWLVGNQSPLASGGNSFGFAASINSNGLASTATKLPACGPGWATKVAVSPAGVWVLGTAEIYNPGELIWSVTSNLLHLMEISAETNPAPLIQLTRPADDSFWGTTMSIPLVAAATDIGGNISRVEFFCDSQLIGETTNAPFAMDWKIAALGVHTLQAVATDNLGAKATSCSVQITVVTPPVNDQFEFCAPIYELGVTTTGSIHGASREPGEPSSEPGLPSRTIWWCWLAPSNGVYTVSTEGTEFMETVGVFTGQGLNDLTLLTSQRYGPTGLLHQVTFRATADTIYFISVGGDSEVTGNAVVQIRHGNPPSNDDFENRILITGLNPKAAESNIEATKQPSEGYSSVSIPSFSDGASVWWSWIAPASGMFSISTEGSSFQNNLRIYTGTNLMKLTSVSTAAWSASSLNGNASLLTFSAIAGSRYEISVDSAQSTVGDIQLEIAPVASPPNDFFADAELLAGTTLTTTGTTFGATAELSEPLGNYGVPLQRSVWWNWSPPVSGTYRFSAFASNTSPSLVVYSGSSLSNLTLVIAGSSGYSPPSSMAVFKAQAGVDYRIAIDSPNDSGGEVWLTVEPATPPVNDDFANRIPLSGAPILISGNTADATQESGEPNLGASVWWSWTAPASTNYFLKFESATNYPRARMFRGNVVTNLTPASDGLNSAYGTDTPILFSALAGETVHLMVAGYSSPSATFILQLGVPEPSSSLVPINDYFSNRVELVGADVEVSASNLGATVESGEPGASCSIGTTVWWTWTAPSNAPYTISTRVSGYGPPLSVYTGTNVSMLTKRVGNTSGEVTFMAESGTAYQIVVGECTMPGQDFSLRIRPAHPPVNDDFTNRIQLEGSYVAASGSNLDATAESGEPSVSGPHGSPSMHTVWWSWTAPASGLTTVTATLTDPPTSSTVGGASQRQSSRSGMVAIYVGSSLGSLTRIGGGSRTATTFQAITGQTYHLQIDGDHTGIVSLTLGGPSLPELAHFTSAEFSNGGLQLDFIAAQWRTNTLEYSTDLVDWYGLTTFPPMTLQNPMWIPIGDEPVLFYRLRTP